MIRVVCKLPKNITSEKFNDHLFKHGAAILKGTDCDMERGGDNSVLKEFFRFSFGMDFGFKNTLISMLSLGG